MTDQERLQALRDALDETTEALDYAHKQRKRIEDEIDVLHREAQGLEMAIQRRQALARESDRQPALASDLGIEPEPEPEGGWVDAHRTDAIEMVLMTADRPLGPSEIARELAERGRDQDSAHLVSSALSHLEKQRRAGKVGRGEWVAPPSERSRSPAESASTGEGH